MNRHAKRLWPVFAALASSPLAQTPAQPPAVPLIAHDPYFSVWSMSERLTDDWPRHWSGATMGMSGIFRADGKPFRWCGSLPTAIPAAEQARKEIGLTTSTYTFRAGGVELSVVFSSPVGMADDPDRASRSVSSATFTARSTDGKPHNVEVYTDLSGEWCANNPDDQANWSRHRVNGLDVLSMGKVDQPVLKHAGDQRKIDWGRVYLASESSDTTAVSVGSHHTSRSHFASTGTTLPSDDLRTPRAVNNDWPVLAVALTLARTTPDGSASPARHVLFGYDEDYAIELFGRPLRPLWRTSLTDSIAACLTELSTQLKAEGPRSPAVVKAEDAFIEAATSIGGKGYANLVTLAYRQVLAGHKVVADWDGTPLMFSKENTSNGCIATVDVIYPACPFFLYHNPDLLKAQLRPLMAYASSPRWRFPFAPHDLGTYPKANGQVYGGGETSEENQMPVEESGNMLIMLAALAKVEGNADFSVPFLPMLETWAKYLQQHGLDPANQLCTDDFAGHIARNANLSAKACVALGGYAQLLAAAGKAQDAARWRAVAEDFASRWTKLSAGPNATVLVFGAAPDKETWSQKYNLIWDRALDLRLFPAEVFTREMTFYRARLQKFGLPLDSRRTYTKLDWSVWTACLTGARRDFDAIMAPTYSWADASPPPSRVPLSDWYETTDGKTMGMHTRTVVGGVWMPLLLHKMGVTWKP